MIKTIQLPNNNDKNKKRQIDNRILNQIENLYKT